jgi:hypothetical protein
MIVNNKYLLRLRELHRGKAQIREVRNLIAKCSNLSPLAKEQKAEIQSYYKTNYGKNINLLWHKYCSSMNGIYSPKYIPHDLFFNKILYFLNDESMMNAYADKNSYDRLFQESAIQSPVSIIKNRHGFFYRNNHVISKEEAVKICSNLNFVFIKPSIESGQGKNVLLFSSANGITDYQNYSVEKLFEKYGKNYVIQHKIIQHPLLSSFNESTLNTFRVVTYRPSSEIVVLGCALKIGKKGAFVDNGFAGGRFVGVDKSTSKIMKYLYSVQTGSISEITESGIILEGIDIPFLKDIFDAACTMHQYLPYARLAAWDMSFNEQNKPVLIEVNINGIGIAIMQITGGPFFGEYTDCILNAIRKK